MPPCSSITITTLCNFSHNEALVQMIITQDIMDCTQSILAPTIHRPACRLVYARPRQGREEIGAKNLADRILHTELVQ